MIKYYDRKNKKYNIEKVAGDKYLKWTYTSPVGMRFLEGFIKKKCFSKLYGKYCDSSISKNKISKFIKDFNINMDEYYPYEYKNFNEFFTRHIKPSSRPIDKNITSLISPCDGKILAYENININDTKTIKGINYKLTDLINDTSLIKEYNGGACLIFRLCPTDYHRFHFIDNGICHKTKKISGHYYSVNPLALDNVKNIFCENKREFSVFHSDNFDNILYIEVGATCVGSIIQTYIPGKYYKKGTEKGYFKFGGSTVILLFKKDIVKIDEDILSQTNLGYECSVRLGEKIGTRTY